MILTSARNDPGRLPSRHRIPVVWLVGSALVCLTGPSPAVADTVQLKSGEELKGVVVEEFADRVTLSAEGGERDILVEDIERIIYDSAEQNEIRLGDVAYDREVYDEALRHYKKALDANPESVIAKRKVAATEMQLRRQRDAVVNNRVAKEHAVATWGRGAPRKTPSSSQPAARHDALLLARLGFEIHEQDQSVAVSRVASHGPAVDAGIQPGDVIVAVWGRRVKYVPIAEVERRLVEGPDHSEVQLTLERQIEVTPSGPMGLMLAWSVDGLTIGVSDEAGQAAQAGLKTGDRIELINGETTRYMRKQYAEDALSTPSTTPVRLAIRRDVALWRRPAE